jgi:hypothetical protein
VRYVVAVSFASLVAGTTHAQQPTCVLQAVEKKLVGPARTDFMQKCEAGVQVTCDRLADQRGLQGANRAIFITNCVNAYVGPR